MTQLTTTPPLDAALKHIATLVVQARDRSFRATNTELVKLYWSVGQYLSQQCQHEGWGQGTVKTLAQLLQTREPGWKGFSAQNLWRMKQFFEAYEGDEELSTRLRKLPWSANLHLLSKCKSRQERAFYLQWMLQEGWAVRQLAQQIDSALFARVAEDYQPAHLGQLEFYLEALDHDHRKSHENPAIGVLLCKSHDHELVEYALSRSLSPALVAQYTTQLQPTKLLLQANLAELFAMELQERGADE